MKIAEKKKIALVLSGGGIKAAAYHIGVCLALQEKGFKFAGGPKSVVHQRFPQDDPKTIRLYVGSSAGAFIAAILSAGYNVESLINAFELGIGQNAVYDKNDLEYLKPFGYRSIFNLNSRGLLRFIPDTLLNKSLVTGGLEAMLKNGLKLNGLFSTQGMEKYLRRHALLENDFSKLGVELYIVATQLNHTRKAIFGPWEKSSKTSTTKYINYAPISEAVACSTSLPPVFSPYGVNNQDGKEIFYYDGEIRETMSTHIAEDQGADLVIASYSMEPYHFTEEMGSLHKYGVPVILNQALYQTLQQKVVRAKELRSDLDQTYHEIDAYLEAQNVDGKVKSEVLGIFKRNLNYRSNVDHIYIAPRPQNYEMFFVDHFSLNPQILERIVRIGFKAGISALRQHNL